MRKAGILGGFAVLLVSGVLGGVALGSDPNVVYSYDAAGRLRSAQYYDGAKRAYVLDAAGNRTQTSTTAGNGAIALSASAYSISESGGSVVLTVSRTGALTGAVSVAYATANGTATAGSDYSATAGTLSWASGVGGNQLITVPIINDTIHESTETFTAALSAPTGGAVLGSPVTATVTINDDD